MATEPKTIDVSDLSDAEKRLVQKHVEACRSHHAKGETNGAPVELDTYPGRGIIKPFRRGELYEDDE